MRANQNFEVFQGLPTDVRIGMYNPDGSPALIIVNMATFLIVRSPYDAPDTFLVQKLPEVEVVDGQTILIVHLSNNDTAALPHRSWYELEVVSGVVPARTTSGIVKRIRTIQAT